MFHCWKANRSLKLSRNWKTQKKRLSSHRDSMVQTRTRSTPINTVCRIWPCLTGTAGFSPLARSVWTVRTRERHLNPQYVMVDVPCYQASQPATPRPSHRGPFNPAMMSAMILRRRCTADVRAGFLYFSQQLSRGLEVDGFFLGMNCLLDWVLKSKLCCGCARVKEGQRRIRVPPHAEK